MRPHHNCMKRARSQSMPALEALPQACFGYTGERAHVGRVLLAIIQSKAYTASWLHTTLETCGSISGQASFSSSLNCLFQLGFFACRSPCCFKSCRLYQKSRRLAATDFLCYTFRSFARREINDANAADICRAGKRHGHGENPQGVCVIFLSGDSCSVQRDTSA